MIGASLMNALSRLHLLLSSHLRKDFKSERGYNLNVNSRVTAPPNVAKPMHVGHIRSAVIGDTLVRVLRFLGDDVTGDVHLGDWGLQMGLLIIALEDEQADLPHFADALSDEALPDIPVTMDD